MTIDANLLGSWSLRAFEFRDAAGTVFLPVGEDPIGQVLFTPDGHMSLFFADRARPEYSAGDLFGGRDAELAAAARGTVAFGGPCRTEDGAIIVDIAYSLFPNWIGGRQKRFYEVAGDRLSLRTPGAMVFGGVERSGGAELVRSAPA